MPETTDKTAILVVDDEANVREIVAAALQDAGHKVYSAESGEAALKIIHDQDDIGMAVLDIRMPGMNGIELAEAIRQTKSYIKPIFVTGFTNHPVPPDHTVIAKPFNMERLLDVVNQKLDIPITPTPEKRRTLEKRHQDRVEDFLGKVEIIEQMVQLIPEMREQIAANTRAITRMSTQHTMRLQGLEEMGEGISRIATLVETQGKSMMTMVDANRRDTLTALQTRDEAWQNLTRESSNKLLEQFSEMAMLFLGKKLTGWVGQGLWTLFVGGIVWMIAHGYMK